MEMDYVKSGCVSSVCIWAVSMAIPVARVGEAFVWVRPLWSVWFWGRSVGGGDTEDIGLGGHGILRLDDWSIGIIGSTFIGI